MVQAIPDFWWFNFTLNQTGVLKLFKVLRESGFGDGQDVGKITAVTAVLFREQFQHIHADGMPHGFGIAGCLFLMVGCYFASVHNDSVIGGRN